MIEPKIECMMPWDGIDVCLDKFFNEYVVFRSSCAYVSLQQYLLDRLGDLVWLLPSVFVQYIQ